MSGTSQWPMSEANIAFEPDAVREHRAVERQRVQRVVGLAAEVELAGEDVDDLVGIGDPRLGEVVDPVARSAGSPQRLRALLDAILVATRAGRRRTRRGARRAIDVEARGVEHLHRVGVALLVVAEQVGVELRRPGHATFQEREVQLGEAPGHPAHHQRAARRLLGGGEVAQVVVDVVLRRHPAAPAVPDAVERGRHAELHAARPQRVVVVEAVVAERVDPRAAVPSGRTVRGTTPFITTAFSPSVPTAWSSSSTASSGVNVGMTATGSSRSR